MDSANFTASRNNIKNNTIFANPNFDYSLYATTPVQSLMHELTHVMFPGVAVGMVGHAEEFYEKMAIVSDLTGIKFSASDLGKWRDELRKLGLPPESIQAIVEDYADINPANDVQCFLADTPILMADGTEKPIQEIVPGDMVMSFDPKADNGLGAMKPGRVRRTFRNTTRRMIDLRGLRMTPGHVVLSDRDEWLKIADVLRQDRAMVEERQGGPVLVRARTGAAIGSDEDAPVTVIFEDRQGFAHKGVVRAGIVSIAQRLADGRREGWTLARVLRHQNYTIEADGRLIDANGRRFDATPWPGGTPFDAAFQHDWVISVDGLPFTPQWIADLRDGEDEAQRVNANPFTPSFGSAFSTPAGNRKARRRLAALRVV
jgi:hypothetical protein